MGSYKFEVLIDMTTREGQGVSDLDMTITVKINSEMWNGHERV